MIILYFCSLQIALRQMWPVQCNYLMHMFVLFFDLHA